ncbi:ankyrin repeat-containing protein [Colletotrichum asianum]
MEVQADANDMRVYVTSRFEECELDDLLERHPELEKEILGKSQGIFLLVRLLVDQLVDLSTVKEMRKALQVFPTHLNEAFESSLQRINFQSKSRSALAHRVMGWIVSAERKLQMSELAHGLATEEGVDVIDEENLVSSKTILKVCGGLVVLQGSAVSMVHTTVHTWLRNRYEGLYHEDLTESCLRYLTMRSFSSGVVQTLNEMDTRLSVFPFFSYAAQHWRSHLAKTEDANAFESIDRLLDDSGLRSAAFQGAHYKSSVKCPVIRGAAFETMPQGQSALHLASYWNLPAKVERLILDGEEKDATDTQMWTPLHWACFAHSQEAVEVLVSLRVDINVKDSVGWTPLFWAALNGDTRMVNFLLKHRAIHIERDIHGWTPLRWAVASLQIDVVKTLLEYHSNMPSNSSIRLSTIKHLTFEETRIYIASYYQNIKRDLIDELESTLTGSDEYADEYHDLLAIFQEKTFDVKDLLRSGRFDPPVGDAWRTWHKMHRLFWAILYRYTNTEFDTDRETTKSWKSRMLQSAIRNGKLLAVRLLLEAGAEVNPKAGQQEAKQTPAATFENDVRFADMLTTYEAHMEPRTHAKTTPLKQEIANRFEDGFLLPKGAHANAVRRGAYFSASRRTPLMIACGLKSRDDDIELPARMVRLLLEYGADPNIKDGGGRTALHYGVLRRNPSTLKLLFDAGNNPNGLDKAGRTQLYNFILHETSPDTQPPFDLIKRCTLESRIECLNILAQRLGSEFLNQRHTSVVKLLIDSGAGIDAFALYRAASEGHVPIVKLLIDAGASIDVSDESGRTSLNQATYEGHHEVVDLLLSSGADPDVGDCQGWTPLHFAAVYGRTETARLLLQAGASAGTAASEFPSDLWHVNGLPDGLCPDEPWTGTPLHLAAMAGSAEITRLLLEENVDVNARTDCFDTAAEGYEPPPSPDCGPTALHIALVTGSCRSGRKGCDLDKGRLEIASMLIERGASVEGAADHLRIEDLAKFENFPQLWDKLRVGITVAD